MYTFNIGSVDSFERQLEQAQKDLGLPAADWVPVQYTTETNWLNVTGLLVFTLFFCKRLSSLLETQLVL